MSFSSFINIITNCFNNTLNIIINIYNLIINNNWIKLIIFIAIIFIIIEIFNSITDVGFNIFEIKLSDSELNDKNNRNKKNISEKPSWLGKNIKSEPASDKEIAEINKLFDDIE